MVNITIVTYSTYQFLNKLFIVVSLINQHFLQNSLKINFDLILKA